MGAWDALPEDERAWWIARHERERDKCQHCGSPRSECSDADKPWYPQRSICYASMESAAANARYDELYGGKYHDGTFPADLAQWSEKRTPDTPYGHRDGVTIWVAPTDLAPDDDFLG